MDVKFLFEGRAMKSYKEIVEKIYEARKSHKEIVFPNSNEKEDEKKEMKEQAPVAPVPDRKYIKGTPEHKAYKATKKPINGMPTNVKEEVELDEAIDPSEIASNPRMYNADTAKKAYYHKKATDSDKASLERHLDRHHGNKEWRKPVKEEADKKKEDDLPFTPDKPKKNPSAVPGKYGIGPSTAKHLAKMGMKKAMKEENELPEEITFTMTAEEFEQLDENLQQTLLKLDERNKENALKRKSMDASRGARFKAQGNYTPDPEPEHKTAQAHNKAVGRAIRQMSNEEVELDEKMNLAKAKMGDVIKDFKASDAPQFKGKSEEKKREMAIAAKLQADRETKKEETEMLSYKEFMMMLEYESKGGVYRHTGSYGSEYAKKEREKDEQGFDAKDDNQSQKRGRGRPAGAKSGARGPRIK